MTQQAGIGGEVSAHMDATFLYVEPIQHLLGLWIPIHDATLANGCLHFAPGTHQSSLPSPLLPFLP